MEDKIPPEEHLDNKKNPLIYVIAVFIMLLVVIFIIPVGSIKWIPQPRNIPDIGVVLKDAPKGDDVLKLGSLEDAVFLETTPFLKHVGSIIAGSCSDVSESCYAKAIYFFVRDNINYVSDPEKEYIEGPKAVLLSGSADCDGQAVLLYSLLKSVGVKTRIAVTMNHAFVQARLPMRRWIYKESMEWISLDPTCKKCEFGNVNSEYLGSITYYAG